MHAWARAHICVGMCVGLELTGKEMSGWRRCGRDGAKRSRTRAVMDVPLGIWACWCRTACLCGAFAAFWKATRPYQAPRLLSYQPYRYVCCCVVLVRAQDSFIAKITEVRRTHQQQLEQAVAAARAAAASEATATAAKTGPRAGAAAVSVTLIRVRGASQRVACNCALRVHATGLHIIPVRRSRFLSSPRWSSRLRSGCSELRQTPLRRGSS